MAVCIKTSIKAKHRNDVPSDPLELICIEIEPPKSKPYLVGENPCLLREGRK